jgi:hypothetical protein
VNKEPAVLAEPREKEQTFLKDSGFADTSYKNSCIKRGK